MAALTPLQQRPVTAVRRRGQLLVPNHPASVIGPQGDVFTMTVGSTASFRGYAAGVFGGMTPPDLSSFTVEDGAGGIVAATFGAGLDEQYKGQGIIRVRVEGFATAFSLVWVPAGNTYETAGVPGLFAYLDSIVSQQVEVTVS